MSLYNETELNEADNLIEQAVAINNLTDGLLSIIILGVMYFILFVALKQTDTKATAAVTTFIMLLVGLLGLGMNLVSATTIGVQIGMFVLALAFTVWRKG